jgi:precorrin-2 dehydrogenase / sirohydrochlorin ferrochelatase
MPVSSLHLKSATERTYYPVFLDISKKPCLVVGGGKVAERKVRILIPFKTEIVVVSPKITGNLAKLRDAGTIDVRDREYTESDLEGVGLVFAATDNREINSIIKSGAEKRNIPVNVVDDPELCDFIVPSLVRRGPVTIAISTSGLLPSLSKRLRRLISAQLSDDYTRYARKFGKIRRMLINAEVSKEKRAKIMKKLNEMEVKELNRMPLREIKRRFLVDWI